MLLEELDYSLPQELIAQYPLANRHLCKLMIYHRDTDKVEHKIFKDIIDYLNKDDVLVFNNTKVFKARVFAKKESGARIEILLLKRINEKFWEALIKPAKRVKNNTKLIVNNDIFLKIIEKKEEKFIIEFNVPLSYEDINRIGSVPLPPYIKRKEEKIDEKYYQTVYAQKIGAVAGPTAGFHFTEELINQIKDKGVKIANITLHLSWGSFAPIRTEKIEEHKISSEYLIIDEVNANIINKREGRCIAVGTSVVRALEFVAKNGKVFPFKGEIDNYIYPGYKFKIVEGLVTNFHLPKTSLLALVAAFVSLPKIKELYEIAKKEEYRFYTYGDAMLIL